MIKFKLNCLTEHYLIVIFFHCTNVLAICLVFVIYLCSQSMVINKKPNSIEYILNKLCSYGSKNALLIQNRSRSGSFTTISLLILVSLIDSLSIGARFTICQTISGTRKLVISCLYGHLRMQK